MKIKKGAVKKPNYKLSKVDPMSRTLNKKGLK